MNVGDKVIVKDNLKDELMKHIKFTTLEIVERKTMLQMSN